jgi:hypothetical protein
MKRTTKQNLTLAKSRHVAQAKRARNLIQTPAERFIAEQFYSAARELEAAGTATIGVVFQAEKWDAKLFKALGVPIARCMMLGAASELGIRVDAPTKASSATNWLQSLGIAVDFPSEFPPSLVDSITATLADSFKRDYWQQVNVTTRNDLEDLMLTGTRDGLSIRDIAKKIRATAPSYATYRATAIARTESSRALNNGHLLGIEELELDSGEQLGKTWVSVHGTTTRPEHAELDGVTIPTGEPFDLGGFPCQFPSSPELPPEHSINCLCSLISGGGELE